MATTIEKTAKEIQEDLVLHLLGKAGNDHNSFNTYELYEHENITGIARQVHKAMQSEGYVLVKESELTL